MDIKELPQELQKAIEQGGVVIEETKGISAWFGQSHYRLATVEEAKALLGSEIQITQERGKARVNFVDALTNRPGVGRTLVSKNDAVGSAVTWGHTDVSANGVSHKPLEAQVGEHVCIEPIGYSHSEGQHRVHVFPRP